MRARPGSLPRAAREAIEAGAARRAQPWGVTMEHWIDHYEARRALFAGLAGAEADAIALIPSVSYGAAVAADVGSAIKGNIIDLWMPSTAAARAWGRRTVTITVYG